MNLRNFCKKNLIDVCNKIVLIFGNLIFIEKNICLRFYVKVDKKLIF